MKPAPDYRPTLRLVSLDIETTAHGELYSIALEGCGQRQVYMLGPANGGDAPLISIWNTASAAPAAGTVERVAGAPRSRRHHRLEHGAVRSAGAAKARRTLPDPAAAGARRQPAGVARARLQTEPLFAAAAGRLIIDGIEALKSATRNFPSFSTEYVSQALLGEGKAIDNPYQRMAEIDRRFAEDKPALARYNLKDCELVTRIFAKADLLNFLLERATVTGLAADRSGGSVAAFSHLYMPRMHRTGFVAPTSANSRKSTAPAAL